MMVWLGLYGSISPLSANGYPFTPIATPTIGGVAFDLAYGLNGNVKVYSFVAHSHAATSFSGDLVGLLLDDVDMMSVADRVCSLPSTSTSLRIMLVMGSH